MKVAMKKHQKENTRQIGLTKACCRRHMLTHVDIV